MPTAIKFAEEIFSSALEKRVYRFYVIQLSFDQLAMLKRLRRDLKKMRDPVHDLTLRSLIAVLLVFVLLAAKEIHLQRTLREQQSLVQLILSMEKQTTLLNEASRGAWSLRSGSGTAVMRKDLGAFLEALDRAISYWLGWFGNTDASELHAYEELSDHYSDLVEYQAMFRLSVVGKGRLDRYRLITEMQNFIRDNSELVGRLDALMREMQRHSSALLQQLRRTEAILSFLTLVIVFFSGLFILRPAIVRMVEALRIRSEFINRISHEIRNQMNSILGNSELLMETTLSEVQGQYLSSLRRSVLTLLELLNSVLDFGALESGKISVEKIRFNLIEAVEKVVDQLAARAHQKGLDLVLDIAPGTPTEIVGDPVRVSQVLVNLVGNAVKFTEAGSVRLLVDVHTESDRSQSVMFRIIDTGPGIPQDKIARVFDSFVQADSSIRRRFGGSGLGLTISRDLVSLMGGVIDVKSSIGRGSEFIVQLPTGLNQSESDTLQDELQKSGLHGRKAWVIGAETPSIRSAQNYLVMAGVRVVHTHRYENVHSHFDYCLIAGDSIRQMLEGPDEAISAIFECSDRVIVLLRTTATPEFMRSLRDRGILEICFKPIRPLELIQERVLRRQLPSKSELAPKVHSRGRVLIADDTADNRLLMQVFLAQTGLDLDFAEDGEDAVRKANTTDYDLILMDIQMPNVDGYEATSLIRRSEIQKGHKAIPIIAVTAHDKSNEMKGLREAGFSDLLTKPVSRTQLMSKLQTWLH